MTTPTQTTPAEPTAPLTREEVLRILRRPKPGRYYPAGLRPHEIELLVEEGPGSSSSGSSSGSWCDEAKTIKPSCDNDNDGSTPLTCPDCEKPDGTLICPPCPTPEGTKVCFQCDNDWDDKKEVCYTHDETKDGTNDSCCAKGDCQVKILGATDVSIKLIFTMANGDTHDIELGDVDEPDGDDFLEKIAESILKALLKKLPKSLRRRILGLNIGAGTGLLLDSVELWVEVDGAKILRRDCECVDSEWVFWCVSRNWSEPAEDTLTDLNVRKRVGFEMVDHGALPIVPLDAITLSKILQAIEKMRNGLKDVNLLDLIKPKVGTETGCDIL